MHMPSPELGIPDWLLESWAGLLSNDDSMIFGRYAIVHCEDYGCLGLFCSFVMMGLIDEGAGSLKMWASKKLHFELELI